MQQININLAPSFISNDRLNLSSTWTRLISFRRLGTGLLGISLFLSGIVLAMRELSLSLIPLEEENAYLEVVKSHRLAKLKTAKALKIAESA